MKVYTDGQEIRIFNGTNVVTKKLPIEDADKLKLLANYPGYEKVEKLPPIHTTEFSGYDVKEDGDNEIVRIDGHSVVSRPKPKEEPDTESEPAPKKKAAKKKAAKK